MYRNMIFGCENILYSEVEDVEDSWKQIGNGGIESSRRFFCTVLEYTLAWKLKYNSVENGAGLRIQLTNSEIGRRPDGFHRE